MTRQEDDQLEGLELPLRHQGWVTSPLTRRLPQVTATDADSGPFGSISYSVGSGIGSVVPTQFSIDKRTGQLCTVQPLDRDEGADAYDFTVTAVDGVSRRAGVGRPAVSHVSSVGALSLPPARAALRRTGVTAVSLPARAA